MRIRYYFGRLSKEQQEALVAILLEEMDMQAWYAVSYSTIMGGEILLPIH
jgi:hypothetical protein